MRKNTILLIFIASICVSKGPMEGLALDFFGGGIGPSGTWIMLNTNEIFSDELGSMGLGAFNDQMIMTGAEGYGHVTENYRLGAIFSKGSLTRSTTDTLTNSNYHAELDLSIVGALFEAVFPLGRRLEISTGSVVGLGQANFIRQRDDGSGIQLWDDYFAKGTQMNYQSVSTNFGVLQPYMAIKFQFLDRLGLRFVGGYNVSRIDEGTWRLNGEGRINTSPDLDLSAPFARVTLYLGI